jgi:hypothetical protein
MQKPVIVIGLISLILLMMTTFMISTSAQDRDDTPTPAPSKTPTPSVIATHEATEIAESETATPVREWGQLRQYTQSDLNILVGNVQRPNGLVWLDNNIYAVCSGDFTMYAIDTETARTVTFVSGIRNANVILPEKTEAGFNLWIPDFDTNHLLRANHLQGLPAIVVNENLDGPWGVALLDDTHFLITNALADNVVLADRDGASTVIIENLRYPTGITVDGNYGYVANRGSARRAIEWFNIDDIDPETPTDQMTPH